MGEPDQAFFDDLTAGLGAGLCGRGMYDSSGAWGGTDPFDGPLVVVTDRGGRQPDASAGFTFISGVEDGVAAAEEAVGVKASGQRRRRRDRQALRVHLSTCSRLGRAVVLGAGSGSSTGSTATSTWEIVRSTRDVRGATRYASSVDAADRPTTSGAPPGRGLGQLASASWSSGSSRPSTPSTRPGPRRDVELLVHRLRDRRPAFSSSSSSSSEMTLETVWHGVLPVLGARRPDSTSHAKMIARIRWKNGARLDPRVDRLDDLDGRAVGPASAAAIEASCADPRPSPGCRRPHSSASPAAGVIRGPPGGQQAGEQSRRAGDEHDERELAPRQHHRGLVHDAARTSAWTATQAKAVPSDVPSTRRHDGQQQRLHRERPAQLTAGEAEGAQQGVLAAALEHRQPERVADADQRDHHRDAEQGDDGAGQDVDLEVDPRPLAEAVGQLGAGGAPSAFRSPREVLGVGAVVGAHPDGPWRRGAS